MVGDVAVTALQAIRAKCLDCTCGSSAEVKACPCEACSLYSFRLGNNPNVKPREYTDEQREQMRARMIENRAKMLTKQSGENTGLGEVE